MEYLIVFCIVLFLLFIAGATVDFLTGVVFFIFTVGLIFIALVFLFFTIVLFCSKKKTAYFTRFGSIGESKIENAVYTIDGSEYYNIFPKEIIFANSLYRENKPVKVRLAPYNKFVVDANAFSTIITGDVAITVLIIYFAPTIAEMLSGEFFFNFLGVFT